VKSAANKPTHTTRGSVLDDLDFSPELRTALKFKAELYQAILKYSDGYSQKELQAILEEPQPRVSELLNRKIANKSVDKLLYYAGRLGIEAKAKFAQTHKEVVEKELAMADTTAKPPPSRARVLSGVMAAMISVARRRTSSKLSSGTAASPFHKEAQSALAVPVSIPMAWQTTNRTASASVSWMLSVALAWRRARSRRL